MIQLTRQKGGRQRAYSGGADSLGPTVHPMTAAGRERELFVQVADHGPTDPVGRDGTVRGQHGDAHRGQRQSTPPVIRPIHRVDDQSIRRRRVTKSDLAGFLGPQNPAPDMRLQHAPDDGIGDHVSGLLDVTLGILSWREMSRDVPVAKTVVDALVNVTQYCWHSHGIHLARFHAARHGSLFLIPGTAGGENHTTTAPILTIPTVVRRS